MFSWTEVSSGIRDPPIGGDCDTPGVSAILAAPFWREEVMAGSDSNSRILVVDDDPLIRKLLTDLLTHDGYEVDAAEDAPAALKLLLRHRYSLLMTDLELPGTSGLELIHEIRGRGLRLPILVVSGNQEAMQKAAVQDLGRAECILKPFEIDAIRAAAQRLLAPQPERSGKAKPKKATNGKGTS
jgi:DNA-binding response OmpR family regulator